MYNTSYKNLIDALTKEVELISLTEKRNERINVYIIISGTKHFSDNESQNYLFFQPISKIFRISTNDIKTVIT